MKARVTRGGGYGPVCPEGEHRATVETVEDGQTEAGRDKVTIRYRVSDGNYSAVFGTYVPDTSWWRELAAAFPRAVVGDELDTGLIEPGSACVLRVEHEVYRGETRARPAHVLPAPAAQEERPVDAECPF